MDHRLKTTFRSLLRNKVNSLINITGLGVSIACCIVIYAFVKHERSFDHFHSKADRIYRLVSEYEYPDHKEHEGHTSFALAKAIRNDFPELDMVTQVYVMNRAVISVAGTGIQRKVFEENEMTYADPYFLKTFDFPVLAGATSDLLRKPDEVILTRQLADKLFGKPSLETYEKLLGKLVTVNKKNYRISAILEDVPRNSNIPFHMLLPFEVFAHDNAKVAGSFEEMYSESYTFITLPERYQPERLEKSLIRFKNKYLVPEVARHRTFHLQALANVHTDENYGGTLYASPRILLLAFITMGVIVILTACINFINLSTAQSVKRAKETGIRKTLGSSRNQLVWQFMSETLLLVTTAALVGLILAHYFLNAFNNYLIFIVDFNLHLSFEILYFLMALIISVTFLAGYYPAMILSGFKPVEALKQAPRYRGTGFAGGFSLRKALVITQFTISQVLIIGTIVVASQMNYFFSKDTGYRKNGIITVQIPENNRQKLEVFRNQLNSVPDIEEITYCSGPPTSSANAFSDIRRKQWAEEQRFSTERKFVDARYLPTFGIKLLAGRNLMESDKTVLTDSINRYNILINKLAALNLGFKSPGEAIGQAVVLNKNEQATIVGVTADYHNASLQNPVTPCVMFYGTNWVDMAAIRVKPSSGASILKLVQQKWEALFPGEFFKLMNMEEYIKNKAFYILEGIMYQAFKIFSMLSVLIGCMGLYGLVAFLAAQRQKEIGIRKVLGSSVEGIVVMFSKEFLWLLLIAFAIAAPLSWLAMNNWLDGFAYSIGISPLFFVYAFLISVGIAGLTIGYQALKAAGAAPVKSLRTD